MADLKSHESYFTSFNLILQDENLNLWRNLSTLINVKLVRKMKNGTSKEVRYNISVTKLIAALPIFTVRKNKFNIKFKKTPLKLALSIMELLKI